MRISAETPAHHAGIGTLLKDAFGGPDEAALVEELRKDGAVIAALVAEDEAGVEGYVLFAEINVEIAGSAIPAAALAPLAVRVDRRKKGLGAALVREGLDMCRAAQRSLIIVVGDPAYYRRFGFSHALAEGLHSPFSGPAMQLLELWPGARCRGTGHVVYPKPFDRFS